MILRVFVQKGVLQEWEEKQGIKLKYEQLDVSPEEAIQEGEDDATPEKKWDSS